MKSLLIKERVFSFTDTYDVYDRNGTAVYKVSAEFLSWGHKLHIYSYAQDREVAFISERVFSFLRKADVEINGLECGTITKEFSFFVPKYSLNYNGWQVKGDFFGWDYQIFSHSGNVATVSKQILSWGDTYELCIENDRDELLALVTVITIDMMNCSGGNN